MELRLVPVNMRGAILEPSLYKQGVVEFTTPSAQIFGIQEFARFGVSLCRFAKKRSKIPFDAGNMVSFPAKLII